MDPENRRPRIERAPLDLDEYGAGGGSATVDPAESFRQALFEANHQHLLVLAVLVSPRQKALVSALQSEAAFFATAKRDIRILIPGYDQASSANDHVAYASVGAASRFLELPERLRMPAIAAVAPHGEVLVIEFPTEPDAFALSLRVLLASLLSSAGEAASNGDWEATERRIRDFRNWQRFERLKEVLSGLGSKASEKAAEGLVAAGLKTGLGV